MAPPEWTNSTSDHPPPRDGDIESIERTGQWVYAGTWVGAGIAMAANAGNAIVTFGALGGNRAVGAGIGIAVDVALIVALIGDRHLARYTLRSGWSRALQIYAMVMGLTIAVSAAVSTEHYLLALLLAGVTPLLWLLMGYGQDVFIKFAQIADRLRTQPAPAQDEPVEVPVRAPVSEYVPWVAPAVASSNGHHSHPGGGWEFGPLVPDAPDPDRGFPTVTSPPSWEPDFPVPAGWGSTATPQAAAKPPTPKRKRTPTPPVAPAQRGELDPELVEAAQRLRDTRAKDGLTTGRRVLIAELQVTDPTARKLTRALAAV